MVSAISRLHSLGATFGNIFLVICRCLLFCTDKEHKKTVGLKWLGTIPVATPYHRFNFIFYNLNAQPPNTYDVVKEGSKKILC